MKKGLISVGVLGGFLLSILMVTGVFAAKDEITFDVSYGKVKFTHKKHAETLKIQLYEMPPYLEGGGDQRQTVPGMSQSQGGGKDSLSKGCFP